MDQMQTNRPSPECQPGQCGQSGPKWGLHTVQLYNYNRTEFVSLPFGHFGIFRKRDIIESIWFASILNDGTCEPPSPIYYSVFHSNHEDPFTDSAILLTIMLRTSWGNIFFWSVGILKKSWFLKTENCSVLLTLCIFIIGNLNCERQMKWKNGDSRVICVQDKIKALNFIAFGQMHSLGLDAFICTTL